MKGPRAASLRVHRIPFSTNVERVALACGIKGVAVEWVDHDPADRGALVALSGQELTPVAEFGDEVVFDSARILERLDREFPSPLLFPSEPASRARAEIFVEWFNDVWKRSPNALDTDAELSPAQVASHAAAIDASTARFEAILGASDYLLGAGPGIADVIAWPFLRYAVDEPDPADAEPFHRILSERLGGPGHPALDRWVERMRKLPQA